jgi:hypothetical protein
MMDTMMVTVMSSAESEHLDRAFFSPREGVTAEGGIMGSRHRGYGPRRWK